MLPLLPLLAALTLQDALVTRKGAHFEVKSHLARESLADEALQAAEAAWPLALAELGLKEKKLAAPLAIHLYADAAGYEAAEQPLTGGKHKTDLFFAHFETRSAHLALHPPCSPDALLQLGLPARVAGLIAHLASRLVAFAYLPNARDYPEWFLEGLGTNVGHAALAALGRMQGIDAEPCFARTAVRCQELLEKGELPPAGRILEAEIGDLDYAARYAVNHRFYALLRERHAKDLGKTAAALRKQEGGAGFRAGFLAELGKLWKEKEVAELDEEWRAWIRAARPAWDERIASLDTRGEGFVQRARPDANAVAFRTEALTALPISAAGIVRAVPGDAHQLNFLLGRTKEGFLSVAFLFPHSVTLFRYDDAPKNAWTVLGIAECKELRIGADIPFRIEAGAEELVVFVAGKETLRAKLQGRSPLGPWGLGAQEKTTGEWKALAVKAGA